MRCPELWPTNRDVWSLWAASSTQWRASGFGVVGLDYLALDWVAARIGVKVTPLVFDRIRLLEGRELARQAEATPGTPGE